MLFRSQQTNNNDTAKQAVVLSRCAADYAMCLSNPFTGPLACVPVSPTVMSLKLRAWTKGEFKSGTAGVGYINADPYSAVASDLACVRHSDAAYAGSTVALSGVAGTSAHFSNSPYINASFTNGAAGAQYRVVSAGLRIRYIGTELIVVVLLLRLLIQLLQVQ